MSAPVAHAASVASSRGIAVRRAGGRVVSLPDLDVRAGDRVGITGGNGSGKTTLLRVLAGLDRTDDGRLAVAAGAQLLMQRPYLVAGTARFNVELALRLAGEPAAAARRRALDALDLLDAGALADRDRRHLSEGEAQRVALARCLAVRPALLLLDEPLGPLDAAGAATLDRALLAYPEMSVVAAAPLERGLPAACRPPRIHLGGSP